MDEQFGNLSKIKIWNIKEALKEYGSIDYDYARLFNLDKFEKYKSKKILTELETKFETIITEIKKYNMNLSTYRRLEEIEKMEMSFELATSMIKHDAEEKGIKIGEAKGILKNQIETAHLMLAEGMSVEQILKFTKLTREQLNQEFNKNKVFNETI